MGIVTGAVAEFDSAAIWAAAVVAAAARIRSVSAAFAAFAAAALVVAATFNAFSTSAAASFPVAGGPWTDTTVGCPPLTPAARRPPPCAPLGPSPSSVSPSSTSPSSTPPPSNFRFLRAGLPPPAPRRLLLDFS